MRRVINIKDLEYTYPDGTLALKGIDIEVFEHDTVGIIGPNGAGKSTLLLHLNGILKGRGKIEVLGSSRLGDIRSKIGMVFQDPDDQLFSPTVFDDVAFGPFNMRLPVDTVNQRVAHALKAVGLSGFEDRCPYHLSFGEKKRIAIATVLSMNPEILVMDEPSSNLDPGARRELIKLLQSLNITKVIATHDLELVSILCNKVILLNKGRKIIEGSPDNILQNEALLQLHGL
jgi:cobalt/nickel transport system ATP-binding protein